MEYSYYEDIRGGKGNASIVRFVRGTQEQFDKMDKTGIIQPNIYMKDDILYFVIPSNTKPVKVAFDSDRPESIEENPFLQESINSDTMYSR